MSDAHSRAAKLSARTGRHLVIGASVPIVLSARHDHETCIEAARASSGRLSADEICRFTANNTRARAELALERNRSMPSMSDNLRKLQTLGSKARLYDALAAVPTIDPDIAADVTDALANGVAKDDIRAAIRATHAKPDPSVEPAVAAAARRAGLDARMLGRLGEMCRKNGTKLSDAIEKYAAMRRPRRVSGPTRPAA